MNPILLHFFWRCHFISQMVFGFIKSKEQNDPLTLMLTQVIGSIIDSFSSLQVRNSEHCIPGNRSRSHHIHPDAHNQIHSALFLNQER
jgi:hypothetical protein